jgi:hypothetical protein
LFSAELQLNNYAVQTMSGGFPFIRWCPGGGQRTFAGYALALHQSVVYSDIVEAVAVIRRGSIRIHALTDRQRRESEHD